jgi:hypothetical protein
MVVDGAPDSTAVRLDADVSRAISDALERGIEHDKAIKTASSAIIETLRKKKVAGILSDSRKAKEGAVVSGFVARIRSMVVDLIAEDELDQMVALWLMLPARLQDARDSTRGLDGGHVVREVHRYVAFTDWKDVNRDELQRLVDVLDVGASPDWHQVLMRVQGVGLSPFPQGSLGDWRK